MIWLPGRNLDAYLPRTPLLKSYSGRMVSRSRARDRGRLGLTFFFIDLSLVAGREARTDDAYQIAALSVGDHHQAAVVRMADEDKALLVGRVIGVLNGNG